MSRRTHHPRIVRPEGERRGCPHFNPWRPAIYRSPFAASGLSGPDAMETTMRKLLSFLIALGAFALAFFPVLASALSPQQRYGISPVSKLSRLALALVSLFFLTGAQWFPYFNKAWTPAQLPGLIAWYKADNDSTNIFSNSACTTPQTTNTGTIQCWKDKSGNGYNLLNSGAQLPSYTLAGLNGKPTVTFYGTGWLVTASGVAMGTGTAGSMYGIGTMLAGTGSNGRLFSYQLASSTGNLAGGLLAYSETG
jgi:hypothetical protein